MSIHNTADLDGLVTSLLEAYNADRGALSLLNLTSYTGDRLRREITHRIFQRSTISGYDGITHMRWVLELGQYRPTRVGENIITDLSRKMALVQMN